MDNSETLATLGAQNTTRRQSKEKSKTQRNAENQRDEKHEPKQTSGMNTGAR